MQSAKELVFTDKQLLLSPLAQIANNNNYLHNSTLFSALLYFIFHTAPLSL